MVLWFYDIMVLRPHPLAPAAGMAEETLSAQVFNLTSTIGEGKVEGPEEILHLQRFQATGFDSTPKLVAHLFPTGRQKMRAFKQAV